MNLIKKIVAKFSIAVLAILHNMSRRSIHSDSSNTVGSTFSPSTNLPNLQHSIPHITITRASSGSQQSRDSSNIDLSSAENSHNPSSRNHQKDPVPRSVMYKTTHTEHYKYRREVMYADDGRLDYVQQNNLALDIGGTVSIVGSRARLSMEDKQMGVNDVHSERSKVLRLIKYGHQYLCVFFAYILLMDLWLLSQFRGQLSSMMKWVHSRGPQILWMTLSGLIFMLIVWWIVIHVLSTMESIVALLVYPFTALISVFDTVMTVSPSVKHGSMENSGSQNTGPSFTDVMVEKTEELQRNYDLARVNENTEQTREATEELQQNYDVSIDKPNLMQMMERMEKLQLNYEDKLSNISQVIAIMIKSAVDTQKIRFVLDSSMPLHAMVEIYHKKLMNVENELKQMKALLLSSNNERIKVEDTLNKIVSMLENRMTVIGNNKDDEYPRAVEVITEGNVREIVKEELKVYDADKTGRVDYALESAGANIISTGSTRKYEERAGAYIIFGYTQFFDSNSPRIVIQGKTVQPGACWAFRNFPGILLIKLRSLIVVTGFTLEHVPKSLQPRGQTKSAVRQFKVWGLKNENDTEPVLFGDYEFLDSDESLQYFPVQNSTIISPYQYVELRIHSNHGNLGYTCLYRFRVHGTPA